MPDPRPRQGERVGTTKWRVGDQVFWRDRDSPWTVQPGACSSGPAFVHITRPCASAVAWQDELVLAEPLNA
jgi:hypothetical protein